MLLHVELLYVKPELPKVKLIAILGLHSISRDLNDKGHGSHVGVHNKRMHYNSIVIVYQHVGNDITCKPRI